MDIPAKKLKTTPFILTKIIETINNEALKIIVILLKAFDVFLLEVS